MNSPFRYFLFIITSSLLFICNKNAHGLDLPGKLSFSKFTTENGLSDNLVYDILKDRHGYLWLATQNGIDRFDGVRFTTFLHNPNDSNSLLNNFAEFLAEDSMGRIWVATAGGLSMYDPSTGKFWNYKPNEEKFQKRVFKVLTAHDGSIWFSSTTHLHKVNLKSLQVTSFLITPPFTDKTASSIKNFAEDHNGNFWFGGAYGLAVFDVHTQKVQVADPAFGLSSFFDDESGSCWIGSWAKNFRKFDFKTGKNTDFLFIPDRVSLLRRNIMSIEKINYPGLESYLWLGTNTQLAVFDTRTQNFVRYYTDADEVENRLPAGYIYKVFYDGKGILWLGTEKGLYFTRLRQLGMQSFAYKQLEDYAVRMVREDVLNSSRLWVDFYTIGLFEIDKNSGTILKQFTPQNSFGESFKYMNDFVQDKNGIIWIGLDSGLIKYSPSTGQWLWLLNGKNGELNANGENRLELNDEQSMWFSSSAGIGLFNTRSATAEYFNYFRNASDFSSHSIIAFHKGFDGNIWVARKGDGLFLFNTETKKFTPVYIPHVNLQNALYHSIAQSPDSTIWYSNGEELFFLRRQDSTFQRIYSEKIDGAVFHILCDKRYVYLAMQTGLLEYDRVNNKFIKYTTEDGLYQNKLYNGINIADDGTIFLCGDGNFTMWNRDRQSMSFPSSPLALESFTVGYRDSILNFDEYKTHPLLLSYKQNQFAVTFRLLSFTHAEQVKYLYKLEGWDHDWNTTTDARASYSHLAGGNYRLKVKALNPDGTENPEQAVMMFHIGSPFWNTWWFYALCLAAITSLLYFIYQLRIQRLIAVQRIRSQISRDLHDEIGASLSSVQIMSSFAEQAVNGSENDAKQWLNRIGISTSEIMEKIRDIVWTLNSSNETSGNIVIRMKQFASHTLELKEIEFKFEDDEQALEAISDFMVKRNVYLIFKEAVNNAAKYSSCSSMHIFIGMSDLKFKMIIRDDGKGFKVDQVNYGNGLRNMVQRANQISGKLEIESSEGGGTAVILQLPVPRLWYRFTKRPK